jgi:hypothetical protein
VSVDRQGDRRVVAQGHDLRGVLRRAHDDLRAVPDEPDRDGPGGAVGGDVGQAGQVAGQQLLADRTVQDLGDLARLHGQTLLPTVVHEHRPSLDLGLSSELGDGDEPPILTRPAAQLQLTMLLNRTPKSR